MPDLDLLYWMVRAASFFNTIAFLWLGLTVLLNAERRPLGTWIAGGGLVLAGLFFALHSTVVGKEPENLFGDLRLLWPYVWILFVGPPFLTYGVITWYGGLLGSLFHRSVLAVVGIIGLGVLGVSLLPGAMPGFDLILYPLPSDIFTVGGVPATMLAFPAYGALCFGCALVVLYRPGKTRRFLGEVGRKRARPWLVAAAALLLVVCIGLGVAAVRYFDGIGTGWLDPLSAKTLEYLFRVDLVVSVLAALVVVLMGRAIVSYEIFTGKVLPRGGLRRYWRNGLLLAAGYGFLMATGLEVPIDPTYRLMLATLLIAVFYALLSWRSYAEREQGMERLRPFVAGPHLYEGLLSSAQPLNADVERPFAVLCEEVLDTSVAYLVPLGPLASLLSDPLSYPPGERPDLTGLSGLSVDLLSPGPVAVPLEHAAVPGVSWAIPLWSERGLIGALLLGDKREGRLYVQEEFEVARATAERLMDIQASSELARRLMSVQRQRLAETQVIDRRTRRVLHDEVLPGLHTALLAVSSIGMGSDRRDVAEVSASLAECHRQIADLLREAPASTPEVERLGVLGALRQIVNGELARAFDGVTWQIDPEAEEEMLALSPVVAEVVYAAAREALRNAARHARGQEPARALHLVLSAKSRDAMTITIEDDGVGPSGAAGSASGGSGQGLALHSTMMAVIGGTLSVEGKPGAGTRVSLVLPREGPLS